MKFKPTYHNDNSVWKIPLGLPFRLKVSSKIFQRKLTEAFGDFDNTFTIADVIIVAGCGKTDDDAKRDHEQKLTKLYEWCHERHIVLNDNDAQKEIGLKEITFQGHKITRDGVKVDERKVKAINEMPTPTNVSGVKRLCGMVQYMATRS